MSAQVAHLEDWLAQGVSAGAVSLAEAWAFQDLAWMVPPGVEVELPECLHPMMDRLALLEVPPSNRLPV